MRQVCRRFRWTHNHKGASRSNMHMLSTGLAGGRVLRRPRYHFRIRICTSLKRKRRQRLRLPPFNLIRWWASNPSAASVFQPAYKECLQ